MDVTTVLFFVFSLVTVGAATRVITARNPVHSALALVLTFVSSAAIWLLMKAEFLGIVLVLVYVGAVMVLFLFVVMMLDIDLDRLRAGFWRSLPVALFVAAIIVVELALVLWAHFGGALETDAPPLPADYDNAKALGELLYTGYIYPLEIAGMVLLVAMVAAISLTIRRRKDSKSQNPGQQVRVRAADRVRLVSMPAVKPEPPQPPADEGDAAGQGAAPADGKPTSAAAAPAGNAPAPAAPAPSAPAVTPAAGPAPAGTASTPPSGPAPAAGPQKS
ncbi:NADH-quinone oxidoreductase subunit J [Lautropia dentalis]|uniref:NADH-quinone oxidoreductase subunit J n=1 Tax=Lautropia dentalis TaxID=2490857 RepID=A0A3R8MSZ3_9BURK|nr:NADH-quinone oxidoreductase subunit J [Lautropia dentalis]